MTVVEINVVVCVVDKVKVVETVILLLGLKFSQSTFSDEAILLDL